MQASILAEGGKLMLQPAETGSIRPSIVAWCCMACNQRALCEQELIQMNLSGRQVKHELKPDCSPSFWQAVGLQLCILEAESWLQA